MNIGERVSGRYKIIGKVGSGGMANVYLAEDLILEREVAVKMMSLDFQEDQSNYRRFRREAASTTELIHPNIVNVYDVGEGDQPYIVMEYVGGVDLKQYIHENYPIPYQKVLNIMKQLLGGIAYAHANGVIHRDIKPHNILIDHDGNIKITDFGIAVALTQNSITQTNSMLGSVQYISPEQARGNVVTKQSDIYSLGIVLYELLTGSVPFDGESAVSIALKHFQTPIPSLSEFDSRIPQPLENVVLQATAKEPIARYATVNEMAKDLETSLSPNRRDEVKFMPRDPNKEDTLVLGDTVDEVNKQTNNSSQTTIVADPEEEETPKDEEPKKNKRRWWLLLIPLLLLIGLFFILQQPGEVDIPDELVGTTYEDALVLLEEYELLAGERIDQANDDVEEGIVFQTSPELGTTIREGSEVDLYVSLGEELFELEDYVNQNFEEVRAELSEAGFTVERDSASSLDIEEGHIIAQNIAAGEEVIASEETITLIVSTGSPTFDLGNYEGQNFEEVRARLSEAGFTVERDNAPSANIEEGHIIAQNIAAGEEVIASEETITLTVSTGRPTFELEDYVAQNFEEVQTELSEIGFTVEREEALDSDIEEGHIIAQNIAAGEKVYPSEETITFTVSAGTPFTIEDYEGQTFEEVRATLSEAGFTVESSEAPSEEIEAGNIIDQSLDAGDEVNPVDETITFTVSTGRPSFALIDLTGYSEASVRDYANNNNLNLTIIRENNEDIPLNQLISQDPEEGTTMYAGDELSVVISDGAE